MSPAKRKPLRLPGGEGDDYRAAARLGYLQAVEDVAPHIAAKLREDVGPPYAHLADHLAETRSHPLHRSLRGITTAPDRRAKLEAAGWDEGVTRVNLQEAVLDALTAWAEPYHLHRDPWILDHALRHLWAEYRNRKKEPVPLGTVGPSVTFRYARGPAPPEYEPPYETRAAYLERVGEYVQAVEGAYRESGWEDTPNRPHGRMHLRWLARFQVNGEKVNDLAASVGVQPRPLQSALKGAAELIGLTRRTL